MLRYMHMKTNIINIPNMLGGGVTEVELFYEEVMSAPLAEQYQFNMQAVSWIKPYGAIALVLAARHLAKLSERPVELQNLDNDVHLYLNRMDILSTQYDFLQSSVSPSEEWDRNPETLNLLELTTIAGPKDVEKVVTRAERVFNHWLTTPHLYSLLNVLSELCANIYQHSGDSQGCVLMQKYDFHSQGKRTVCLAVGDLGCGIRGSMVRRHGEIGAEPLDYLQEAMQGKTSRANGRGGLGLRTVEQIASASGGYLWLRSETAAICRQGANNVQTKQNLPNVAGTQVAVDLDAPLN